MADGKKPSVSKTTKRATATSPFSSGNGGSARKSSGKSGSRSKAVARTAGAAAASAVAFKAAKKINGKSLFIALICLILAAAIGVGVCFVLGKNDRFDIVGNDELSLELGSAYKDEGVNIKEFGLDLSKNAAVETNLKQNANGEYYADEVGTYHIVYTVKSLKFGLVYKVQKIRLITFVEPSELSEDATD